ncbi:MAG: ABC transporter permease [Methanomassiliicoccaceae archaeon]|nr:ABC transporter permease [Methanomassiliicoccaceae archaeon]
MTETSIIPAAERKVANRISLRVTLRNTFTLAYRAWLKMVHSPEIFMEIALLPIIMTLAFTFLFGGAIAGSTAGYLPVVIPGILVWCCAMGCNAAGTKLREDMSKGITTRLASMPISRFAPVGGMLITDISRYVIVSVIVFALGYGLGYRPETGLIGVIACIGFMSFTAWCLSWIFAFIGVSSKSVSSASTIGNVIMFPLAFMSNALVPVETLPGWLQFFVVHINPLSYIVTGLRQLLSGSLGMEFWGALLGALLIVAVFAPLTMRSYAKKA